MNGYTRLKKATLNLDDKIVMFERYFEKISWLTLLLCSFHSLGIYTYGITKKFIRITAPFDQ